MKNSSASCPLHLCKQGHTVLPSCHQLGFGVKCATASRAVSALYDKNLDRHIQTDHQDIEFEDTHNHSSTLDLSIFANTGCPASVSPIAISSLLLEFCMFLGL